MNNFINELITKDPLILLAAFISLISFIFIIILSYYYRKLKEEKTISEIVSSVEEPVVSEKTPKKKTKIEYGSAVSSQDVKKNVTEDIELVIAQINELSNQVGSLNNHIKEITSMLKNIQQKPQDILPEPVLSEETITKLIDVLQKVQIDLTSLLETTKNSSTSISEVNKKLDNLLKLISTILQQ
ncbi:MAG: hypothetical protein NZ839_01770 [Endomicrobia bacterium]|nr:hypothetical protein [Endomicrobiia bacterium]